MIEVETKRLKLRNYTINDSIDVYEYGKNELVGPDAGWSPHKSENESIEIIKMFIKDDDVLAIELKNEKKVIGSIGLHHRVPDKALKDLNQREIGYVLNPKYWGNGYVPEAVEGLLEMGFIDMNLDLIWCGHFEKNIRSKRVVEKCGFKYKFTKERKLELLDNKIVNQWYYSLSKNEFINYNKTIKKIMNIFKAEPYNKTLKLKKSLS